MVHTVATFNSIKVSTGSHPGVLTLASLFSPRLVLL